MCYYLPHYEVGMAGNVLMLGTVHSICAVSFRYLDICLSVSFKLLQYFWNG